MKQLKALLLGKKMWLFGVCMLAAFIFGWNLHEYKTATAVICNSQLAKLTSPVLPQLLSPIHNDSSTDQGTTTSQTTSTTALSNLKAVNVTFDPAVSGRVATRITELYEELTKNGSVINDIVPSKKTIIPNIYHFIHFNQPNMSIYSMLAIKSALQVAHADVVYIHCNQPPVGRFWDMISSESRIRIVHRQPPKNIFGKDIYWIQHAADLARIQILREYGGIYLDNDCLVVNEELSYLRQHKCVVAGSHRERFMGNQILMGTRDCAFLALYEELYRLDYRYNLWYFNGGQLPQYALIDHFPGIVYVSEEGIREDIAHWLWRLDKPLVEFQKRFRIIHLYCLYKEQLYNDTTDYDEENIKTGKNSFSRIARWLIYGHEEAL